MDANSKYTNSLTRHLTTLKLVSRLLGHEMHVQTNAKAVSLTREQVLEIQSSIDLFIEEAGRRVGSGGGGMGSGALGSGAGYSSAGGGYGPTGGGSTSLTPTAIEATYLPTRN